MSEISDEQLISRYLDGDEKSLEILINRYLQIIYNFVCRLIGDSANAEEITQEAFIRMWQNLKKFDESRCFKTWMFAIAKNASLDWLRKKKAVVFSAFNDDYGGNDFIGSIVDSEALPDELLQRQDLLIVLESALRQLPQPYRIVLHLYYNDHLNFREIGESLDEPLNTVKSRHRRALAALKELLIEKPGIN